MVQPLYCVKFRQADLWELYPGNPGDTLTMEVYQPWLLPASEAEFLQQAREAAQRLAGAKRKHPEGEHGHGSGHEHPHKHEDPHDHAHDHVHEVWDLFGPPGLPRCSV